MNDLKSRLIAAFKAESAEHLAYIRTVLDTNGLQSLQGETLDEIFRRAHSLKGAARAVDLPSVQSLAHTLENLFARLREKTLRPATDLLSLIGAALDEIEDRIAAGLAGDFTPDTGPAQTALQARLEAPEQTAQPEASAQATAPETPSEPPIAPSGPTVRLAARRLDSLLETAGQLQTETLRQHLVQTDLQDLVYRCNNLEKQWQAFDRLARLSGLPVGQVAHIGQHIRTLTERAQATEQRQRQTAWNLNRVARTMQGEVQQVRLVPASGEFAGLRKMVRDLAREAGKTVAMRLTGLDVEADRAVLQALKDPLMHLLRNAVDHGIEPIQERRSKGKDLEGHIDVRFQTLGAQLIIDISDDGQGINSDRVVETARQKGLLLPTDTGPFAPDILSSWLFQPGFSTREQVTDLSGRGMGLSVVAEAVISLQGSAQMLHTDPNGTTFRIAVPQTLTAHRLLLITCNQNTFGIPVHGIERLYRSGSEHIQTLEGRPVFKSADRTWPLAPLAGILGLNSAPTDSGTRCVAVLKGAGKKAAVIVDAFQQVREAIIQQLDTDISHAKSVSGGFFLPDGSPALVLNPAELVEAANRSPGLSTVSDPAAPAQATAPKILVVDDSITTRTLEKSILETHGFQVDVAVDGQEALEKLRANPVDLIVTDIEMPRLDGFALLQKLKADPHLVHIPVIIVTSRQNQNDRTRGLEMGADAYVVKQKFDQRDLLDTIAQFVSAS